MKSTSAIPRRKFLKLSALSGTFFALGYITLSNEKKNIVNLHLENDVLETQLNPFIFIDNTGAITIFNHRPEMGQGTYQAIPMIIAEELEVDIKKITIKPSPANAEKYGDQMVVGSHSIQSNYSWMRKVGASAKEMLVKAAADKWSVPVENCYAENGMVINRNSGAKFSYGELVSDAKKLSVPENPKLKDPGDFKIIGKSVPRQDTAVKLNGTAKFGMDITVPGMLYASIERSPLLLGKLISFNDEKAKTVKGVKYILKTQREVFGQVREGVAVIADSYWAATQGRKMLEVKWDNGDLENWSTQKIKETYIQASTQPAEIFKHNGDFENNFNGAAVKIEASYETPYQTHAPMEPMNVVVSVEKDQCEFWGSTQNPNGVKSYLSKQLGIPEPNVKINYTFMGGAFGRRSMTDVAEEAAHLSKKLGAPIKVIWTREDDLTQGPFRACSLNVCRGAFDKEGNLISLEHKVICQDIRNQSGNNPKPTGAIAGGINTEYEIPNLKICGVLQKFYIPVSYWRSVYHSTNCFAHESFIDELAHAAKKDPLDFRLSLLRNHKRYTQVLQTVAEKSNWYKSEKDIARGVAIVERSGAFVAMVAEIKKHEGKITVTKIIAAIDCGTPINPDIIKAQTEGCIVMGLTATYKSGLTVEKGKIVEQNFHTYKMLRINECPEIEVHVIPSTEQPEGAGEAGLPTVAPAVTNAIFALTKKRIRTLPFNLNEW